MSDPVLLVSQDTLLFKMKGEEILHDLAERSPWDSLLKRILWEQLGDIEGKRILDFRLSIGILVLRSTKIFTSIIRPPEILVADNLRQ